MNKNSPIGIFDSGIGGSTVLREMIKLLPKENYFYYSDSVNCPYGDKPIDEVQKISETALCKLLEKDCKICLIACNTASAKAAEYLRNKYSDKIRIFAIEPAYKMAHDISPNGNTLILATEGTIRSEKFRRLFSKYYNHKTTVLACKGLADLIEANDKSNLKIYLQDVVGKYSGKVQNVVLGCTHYPLIKDELRDVLGDVSFYDGSVGISRYAKKYLQENDLLADIQGGEIEFVDTSEDTDKEKRFYEILREDTYDRKTNRG